MPAEPAFRLQRDATARNNDTRPGMRVRGLLAMLNRRNFAPVK